MIQYTVPLGEISTNVVRTIVAAAPAANEVVLLIGPNVKLYNVSRISEGVKEIANRYLNHTQYAIPDGTSNISGLIKPTNGASGIVTVETDATAMPLDSIGVFLGTNMTVGRLGSAIVYETIMVLLNTYLETDGVK